MRSLRKRASPELCACCRYPTRTSFRTVSLSISSLLVASSRHKFDNPVTLPPGRARLATKASPTGSGAIITIGIVAVLLLAANAGARPVATIRSTLRRTSSAASFGKRSNLCSVNRYSKVTFFPSVQPRLLSSLRNASHKTALPEAVLTSSRPMRKIFPACCAEATTPPRAIVITTARVPANFRFWILDCRNTDWKLSLKNPHSYVFP